MLSHLDMRRQLSIVLIHRLIDTVEAVRGVRRIIVRGT
jgi:hypothetical protein